MREASKFFLFTDYERLKIKPWQGIYMVTAAYEVLVINVKISYRTSMEDSHFSMDHDLLLSFSLVKHPQTIKDR